MPISKYEDNLIFDKELVRWCFKLFLDREPENEDVLNIPFKNIKELRQNFLSSEEFCIKNKTFPTSSSIPKLPTNIPPPPNTIPDHMFNDFTINGKINVLYQYFNDGDSKISKIHNTVDTYKYIFNQIESGIFKFYEHEGLSLLKAIEEYPIHDMNVIVWGLQGCDCDAISLWKGARKVYVIDNNKPICENDKIHVFNYKELTQNKAIKADFSISYSSFEHDGLGRFGDPLSGNGDIFSMQSVHRHLLNNGILFLGVPLGQDCLVWNGHRIYGKHRLPLLLKGWELLDVFDNNERKTTNYPFDLELGDYIQNVLVLRKIESNYPNDKTLLNKLSPDKNQNEILTFENINKYIYNFIHEKN